jgi:Na+-driven multidrug efflux pump
MAKSIEAESARTKSLVMHITVAAIPNILTSLVLYALQVVNTIVVGQLNSKNIIAAVGLGNMTVSVFAYAFL